MDWKEKYEQAMEENHRSLERISKLRDAVQTYAHAAVALEVLSHDDMLGQGPVPHVGSQVEARQAYIDYTNWRGVRSERRILPVHLWYGSTEHHERPGWLVRSLDLDRQEARDFSLSTVHSWK